MAGTEQLNSCLCFPTRSYLVLNGLEIRGVAKPLTHHFSTQTPVEHQLCINYAQRCGFLGNRVLPAVCTTDDEDSHWLRPPPESSKTSHGPE